MIELERLAVSLTKNGYFKIAEIVKGHPRWEVLDNVEGTHRGINVKRSQAANILGADPATEQLPEYWDDIRQFGDRAIEAFTFVAIVLSHHRLIELFQATRQSTYSGHIRREDLAEKEYTNLIFAMASLDLCDYERGAHATNYDFFSLLFDLQGAGDLVRQLIESKLTKCGWLDPQRFEHSPDKDLLGECRRLRLHQVFGMTWADFDAFLKNDLEFDEPERRGVRRRAPIGRRRPR